MEQTRPHISVYRWVSWMLLGLKCSCFLCWLKYLLASNSWESEGALNNVEFRSSHVSCSCVFFSLRPMLADLPRKQAAKHSRHSGRSMQTRLWTPSCHGGYQIQKLVLYSNLLTIYGICASSRGAYVQSHVESYVQSYMCIFLWHCCSYVPLLIHMAGERSWLAQRFSPHHVVGRRWGNLLWQASERGYQFYFPKDVFVWALWVSQVFAILCFLLVSLNLLSLIFLLIAATGAVRVYCEELWCIGATRLWRKGLHLLCEKPAYHIYVEEVTSQGGNVRVGTQTGAFSEGLATSPCSASSIDRLVVVRRERAIDPL